MSDEEISKAPAQDVTSTDTDVDNNGGDVGGPRVFDITPDLNIAPAKDETEASTLDATNPKLEAVSDSINLITKPIVKTEPKIEPELVKEPVKEPIKEQASFGPANPPAKTVGMNRISQNPNIEQSKPVEPSNLQEAVASIKINPDKQVGLNARDSAPKIPEKPWLPRKDSIIKPLRTYETDFAEAMARKHITTTSAIIAEEKRSTVPEPVAKAPGIIGEVPLAPSPMEAPNPFQSRPMYPIGSRPSRSFEERSQADIPANFPTSVPSNVQANIPATITRSPDITPKEDIFKNATPPTAPKVQNESHTLRNFLLVIVSLALVAGGIYAGYYLYTISPLATMLAPSPTNPNATVAPTVLDSGSFFQTDSKVRIAIDAKNENQIISMIRTEVAKPDQENKIKEIILTRTIEGQTTKVPANEILNTIKIPVPELITRSLAPAWMLGVYTGIGDQKHVFVITTNTFFQNTFAGIIQWEKSMPDDLKNYTLNPNDNNQTTKGQYKDRIIKNKDVREYVTENGHINYLYSFISNDKLVITDSEEALDEIIIRIEKNAYSR